MRVGSSGEEPSIIEFKKMKMKLFAALAASAAMVATSAAALVTFDPATGTGFVGKGDVQLAFGGWNNAQLQSRASGVTFKYRSEESYKFDCTFTVEVGRDKVREPRTQNRGAEATVNGSIAYESRKNSQGQITGFNLTGFGPVTYDGIAPVEGGTCPGGQFNDGVISNVELVGGSSAGGLFVVHGGIESLLTIGVPAIV